MCSCLKHSRIDPHGLEGCRRCLISARTAGTAQLAHPNQARCADRFIITLCHGPAALLAVGLDRDTSPLTGYESCAFPDALDTGANLDLGYIPGPMPWLLAEGLRAQGLVVVNEDMAGHVHRDRGLLTGESPLAADALGKLAATTLVEATKS